MATTIDSTSQFGLSSRADHSSASSCNRLLFGQINFGPRFKEGFIDVKRTEVEYSIYYRIYNPSSLHSIDSPPLLVLHGGPSLPSDYLFPLVHQFSTSRSIIFYDQLGCGRSSQPEQKCLYSIQYNVNDLKEVINSLQIKKYHLLGHSFGGIVAYEFVKSNSIPRGCANSCCLSITLYSTPTSIRTSLEECSRLEMQVRQELLHLLKDEEINDEEVVSRLVQDRLHKQYECRTDDIPDALRAAIKYRGTTFGPEDVVNYIAYPPSSSSTSSCLFPPVLVIRGQHDFVTEICIKGWRDIFGHSSKSRMNAYREETMASCAHYSHLEDSKNFGDLIKNHLFINDY